MVSINPIYFCIYDIYSVYLTDSLIKTIFRGKIKGTQIIAYARNPYYYLLQTRCRAATSMYCTWNVSNELENEVDKIVEMVTIPNNPDGKEYEPWYDTDAIGHDLVYYWPHFYEAEDIYPRNVAYAMFSFTKMTGHAASRFGFVNYIYAWVSIFILYIYHTF